MCGPAHPCGPVAHRGPLATCGPAPPPPVASPPPATPPPSARSGEQPNRRPTEAPNRPTTEPPDRRAAQQPSPPAAEPPSSRAARQPSRPAPCSQAAQQPSRPVAEPPDHRAAGQPDHPTCLGRAVDFEVWVDDLQLILQCDRADGLSQFDLTFGASPAPAADADATVCSQWATRDATARLAVRRHLPTTKRAHFSQYKSAQTFDARYRAAFPAEFCAKNPPPMYITLYYIVIRLHESLRVVRDHFLSVCPTTLTGDLLEKALLAKEKSIVAVGASRGDPRTPVFEGCSPSPLLPCVASAAAADLVRFESVGAASAPSGRRRTGKGKGGKGTGGAGGGGGAMEAAEAVEVAQGAEAAEVVEEAEMEEAAAEAAVVERVATLRRGVAPVVVSATSSSGVV
ncbi:unnamed protein product [Closterium sp. NIES-64]|nr:unnamed protein product [Closterium sp. NIES-64]